MQKERKKMENRKERVVYFDILNILAILGVVAMHCNAIVHKNPNISAWDTSLIVNCICYWAVPVFCMLSGANLMTYREKYDTKTFFKKRALKILIPFIFWAAFMFIWKIALKQIDVSKYLGIKDWVNAFFANKEETTYYFMFSILGIYLTMPLLSLLAKEEYRKTLWLTVILYFIFNAFLPNILLLAGIKFNDSFMVLFKGYTIYCILGYLLSTEELGKKKRIAIYIGAIIGLIYQYTITFILSKQAGSVIKTTWGYTSWHCILLSCSIFLLIKNMKINDKIKSNEKVTKALVKISSCSFGIYLIHQIVKYYELHLLNISTRSWQFRTIGIFTTYLISLGIVYVLKKIPIVKKILP